MPSIPTLDDYVDEIVAQAPALTPDQAAALAALLRVPIDRKLVAR